MILNVNRLLHTPGASQDFHFEMDLSDLEFDRCMEEFDAPKSASFSCVLAQEKQDMENDDIVLLDHDEVDLADLAGTAFILDMDTKTLCSEDCKGLCPGCGVNLNREACRCKKQVDPRLAKLAQLLAQDDE